LLVAASGIKMTQALVVGLGAERVRTVCDQVGCSVVALRELFTSPGAPPASADQR
jgi:hypothetical protein